MNLQAKLRQRGRDGGLTRANRLTSERRSEIASLGGQCRCIKQRYGITRRELAKRFEDRLRQLDPDLSWWTGTALRAPSHIGVVLIDLLSEQSQTLLAIVADEIVSDLDSGTPQATAVTGTQARAILQSEAKQ